MDDVCAVLVTFNPDLKLLRKVINNISAQVNQVYIIDNASSNFEGIKNLAHEFNNVALIRNRMNVGSAGGLNVGRQLALGAGFDWMLAVDQDTLLPKDYTSNLLRLLRTATLSRKVGILAGKPVDPLSGLSYPFSFLERFKKFTTASRAKDGFWEPSFVITSGALINNELLNHFKWRRNFFLDLADYDFCVRARENGFAVLMSDSLEFRHFPGKHILVRGKVYLYEPSNRYYYIVRNALTLLRERRYSLLQVINAIAMWLYPLILAEGVQTAFKTLLRAFTDGIRADSDK